MAALRSNLTEQHAWMRQQPKNALQQCLNSHVISAYLDSRAARKAASVEGRATIENAAETIRRGAAAQQLFDSLTRQHSGPLCVEDMPQVVDVLSPPLEPFEDDEQETETATEDGDIIVGPRSRNGVDVYTPAPRTERPSTHREYAARAPVQQPSCTAPTRTSDLDVHDSLFEEVDVDAIVASRTRTIPEPRYAHQQRQRETPRQSVVNDYPPPPRTSSVPDTSEEIKAQIKATREKLRKVREECDDASLEGDIPQSLVKARTYLEQKLEELSRQYRNVKTATSGSDSYPPHRERDFQSPDLGMPDYDSSTVEVHSRSVTERSAWTDTRQSREKARPADMYTAAKEDVPVTTNDPKVKSKMLQAKRVLRDVFGHNAFRPNQERIVMEAFSRRDVFVLMPTGGGKSLCYQLPACVDEGVTVVISPLVSLIQDQVQQLEALEVGVAHLNGDQDYETVQRPIISELFSNRIQIKLLYVTPEKIASSNTLNNIFESLEKRGLLARFVVDEAHCISQWGHDFRKDYMNLGQLRAKFRSVPIMALTATANTQTEADIVRNLKLANPFITRSSFNRPNLTYDIRRKTSKFMEEIANFVRQHSDDSGIIYCLSKKDCEQVAEKLIKALGYEGTRKAQTISFYHAGLEPEDRAHRHHEWSKGKIKLIVATVAFGMGINKPDVRYVIHHTIPQSVTHYYQEAGRAGRDSEVAHCILYYSFPDLSRRRKLITKDRENMQHRNVHLQHLRRMVEFCENQVECRRTSLLEYFGEHFSSDSCRGTCDNCKNRAQGLIAEKTDVTSDCLTLLNIVRSLQAENEPATLVQISQTFLGQLAKGKEWKKDQFTNLEGFGAGKGRYGRSEVERILYHMILRHYLRENDKKNKMGFTTTFIALGQNADRLTRGERVQIVCKTRFETRRPELESTAVSSKKAVKKKDTKKAKKPKEPRKAKSKASAESAEELSDDFDEDVVEVLPPVTPYPLTPEPKNASRIPIQHVEALAQLLKDWRASVCDNFNVMPYHILPTTGIAAIANAVPVTNAELSEIDGVGRIRVKKYGDAIIEIVKTYLNKHNLTPTPSISRSDVADQSASVETIGVSPFFREKAPPTVDAFDEDDIDWSALDDTILDQSSAKRKQTQPSSVEYDMNSSKRYKQ
ncbi:hypothetical protein Poli38472_014141 [Pythium oligandrum]|uniref:DNA 3'-5' helicase n=1 Tax=Pythium oligandrum TaxID=41045 RepID=A0A8K1CJ64_PYTOL|nr:hypothetical protein Poli38472_014141 [Pythium oligandrum]|eukprot:TMW64024.1 hypothetical protein Poli38472_014141 [Pythium oligandrum]